MLININIYIIIMLIGKMKNSRKVPISGSEIKIFGLFSYMNWDSEKTILARRKIGSLQTPI